MRFGTFRRRWRRGRSESRLLSSDAFREALFEKLHVPDGLIARSHDFRMQIDVGGFTLGSHPDAPQKIVTMMLYFPKSPSDARYARHVSSHARAARKIRANESRGRMRNQVQIRPEHGVRLSRVLAFVSLRLGPRGFLQTDAPRQLVHHLGTVHERSQKTVVEDGIRRVDQRGVIDIASV